jgi:A/G-specific adenine glycosylase
VTGRGAALLEWYRIHRRDLPWRRTSDPYRILVSEVMLQQTGVSRVIPFYERFMARYPTIESLADARLSDVLDLWHGLGYPSRARRLRDAARCVVTNGWPDDLTDLPGIGPYTAAAVGSIAFDHEIAVVDTNVRRVLSRWRGTALDGARLRDAAAEELTEPASTWNQAVMELGATVCRRSPDCDSCPVAAWCTDPTVYAPPPPQARYEGSARQERGRILARLVDREQSIHDLAGESTMPERVPAIVADLASEGMVTVSAGMVAIAR